MVARCTSRSVLERDGACGTALGRDDWCVKHPEPDWRNSMGDRTDIAWTQKTWNPWHGCHKVSPGCKFCYMFREKRQYGQDPDVVVKSKTKFNEPLKWKEPSLVFTCSWSDWFIEEADPW